MRFAAVIFVLSLISVSILALSDQEREDFVSQMDLVLSSVARNGLSNTNKEQFNNLIERAKEIGISKALVESQINEKLPKESISASYFNAIIEKS